MGKELYMGRVLTLLAAWWCVFGVAWAAPFHDADTSQDAEINLSELLRVVQFYNLLALHCDVNGEDGFAPGPGDTTCQSHDSDYAPQNWAINLAELLRLIQFYNSTGYYACSEGEDGYCPGEGTGEEGEGTTGDDGPQAAFFSIGVSGQAPLVVQFFDVSDAGDAPVTAWSWDFGDGTDSAEQNPVKTYDTPGTYSVSLTVTTPLGSDTYSQTDLVNVAALSPALLASSDPADGEDSVAVTRELILNFSAPLSPSVLFNSAVVIRRGTQQMNTYRNLSPDGRRLTLFPSSPMSGNTTLRAHLDGAQLLTTDGRAVDVDGDGNPGGTRIISYTTLGLGALQGTAVFGRVFASEFGEGDKGAAVNVPLAGVEIFIDGRFDISTITDANGNFRLEPVPAGRFFVHIDGLNVGTAYVNGEPTPTSFPSGPYYPFVGKAWEAVAGRENNVGDIYLPLIPEGALTPVSETSPTPIAFTSAVIEVLPEYEGAGLIVPPDTLYRDFGTRGGSMGIAPVAPDRLPSPLPPGLDLPMVITVQTDGPNNFDQPVPACFPNLPDPATGEPLPPGASSALWSFDHDEGEWSIVGPMTVSDDGRLVCTDPGVGILEPGWHGSRPGSGPGSFPGGGGGGGDGNGAPQRCVIDDAECGQAVLWGVGECALSFVPGFAQAEGVIGCGWSLASGGVGLLRDCVIPPGTGTPDRTGCVLSGVFGGLGVFAACGPALLNAVPVVGQAITCIGGGVDIVRNCTCVGSKGTGDDAAIDEFERMLDFLTAYRDLIVIELGAAKWTEIDWYAANFERDSARVVAILELLTEVTSETSGEGETISAAEAQELGTLALPDGFSAADVNALITYRNNSVELWGDGTYTHASAGRTDFMDQGQVVAALDALALSVEALGGKGTPPAEIPETVSAFYEVLVERFSAPAQDALPLDEIDYALTDVATGLTSRGQLTSTGALRVVALAPERYYRIAFHHLPTGTFARAGLQSAPNGEITPLPRLLFTSVDGEVDTDLDGLADVVEPIYNTAVDNDDTDEDGLRDRAELEQGSNPLDGIAQGVGALAEVATLGFPTDVNATSDYVAVAEGAKGVSVFNVYNGMPPAQVAQVELGGLASQLACEGPWIAVAGGAFGWALVDVSNPAEARAAVPMNEGNGTYPACVAVSGEYAYFGTQGGRVDVVYMPDGSAVDSIPLPEPVNHLSVSGDILVAMGPTSVTVMELALGVPDVRGVFPHARQVSTALSIVNADPVVYLPHFDGYDTVDISDRTNPVQLGRQASAPIGTFRSVALNGSGLVLANYTRAFNVQPFGVFDGSNPAETENLVDEFDLDVQPTDFTLHNGYAYFANPDSKLVVFNYLAADTGGVPPGVTFEIVGVAANEVDSLALLTIRAVVTDDVQVRNVELLVDGDRIATDGTFPFEFRYRAPDLVLQDSVSIAVAASDTGGNRAVSAVRNLAVVPEATAPHLVRSMPANNRVGANVQEIVLTFNEPMRGDALELSGFTLTALGADGERGGSDDSVVPLAAPALDARGFRVTVSPSAGGTLADGLYALDIDSTVLVDLSGNPVATDVEVIFGNLNAAEGENLFNNLAGGSWNDPANWSLERKPQFDDTARIDIPGRDVVVNVGNSQLASVGSLDIAETLEIAEIGELQIYGATTVRGDLLLSGKIKVTGSSASLVIASTLDTQPGARIELSGGALASITGETTLDEMAFRVDDTCTLNLGTITEATGTDIVISGENALLNVDNLAVWNNPRLTVENNATVALPVLDAISVDQPSSSQMIVYTGGSIDAAATSLSIDGTVNGSVAFLLSSDSSGQLTLPALATIDRQGDTTLTVQASGGSTFDLPLITGFHGQLGLSISGGGVMSLESATSIDMLGSMTGEGSTLEAPLLQSLSGQLSVSNTTLALPALEAMTDFSLTLYEATFNAILLDTLEGSSLTLTLPASTFSAPSLATIINTSMFAQQGAMLTLSNPTAMTVTDASASLYAQDAGSSISLPGIATIAVDGTLSGLTVTAFSGGAINLQSVGTIITPELNNTASFNASGTGSSINLSSLVTFNPTRVTLTTSDSGVIDLP